jgi:hypothetical protein
MPVCTRCHSPGWASRGGVAATALKSHLPLAAGPISATWERVSSRIVLSELAIAYLAHNWDRPSDVLASGTFKPAAFGSSVQPAAVAAASLKR